MGIENNFFPNVKKSITNYLYEEEANISRSKMLAMGSLMILVSFLLLDHDVFAAHRSHSSHASHASHASHVSGSSTPSYHYSHSSHVSHASHVSSSGGVITPSVDPSPDTGVIPEIPVTQVPQLPQNTPVLK
jgi:hypothetical protein